MLAYNMKSLKNIVQSSITGKLNPAFSFPSAVMASHEALTLLPKLAAELQIAPNNKRILKNKELILEQLN